MKKKINYLFKRFIERLFKGKPWITVSILDKNYFFSGSTNRLM